MPLARVYLTPGLFGFARLAGVEYFQHVRTGLEQRFGERGRAVEIRVFEAPPTASLRRRATRLARLVDESAGSDEGPIHLLGHSTGGLDVRLVASPTAQLEEGASRGGSIACAPSRRSTALTTARRSPRSSLPPRGQRVLYAVSAITVAALRLGSPPLVATSALVAALARTRERVGLELGLIDRITAPREPGGPALPVRGQLCSPRTRARLAPACTIALESRIGGPLPSALPPDQRAGPSLSVCVGPAER